MPIPDYQSIMRPLLEFANDGEEHSLRKTVEKLGKRFDLSEEEQRELLPSGRQSTFENRVGWARTYLTKACLLEPTKRAHFKISPRGKKVLEKDSGVINAKFLSQFKEFCDFRTLRKTRTRIPKDSKIEELETPEETIETAYQNLRDSLANELLKTVCECSPSFFEGLVVDLLVKMGYGGTRKDAGKAIGRSGDGGVDGIIKEDRLGLDVVYIQAKRWNPDKSVGRPEIQKFAGALQGFQARKGVFISTCSFSKEAQEFASRIDSKIVLIDGDQLTQLMTDFGIGVNRVASYEVNRIDADYFSGE